MSEPISSKKPDPQYFQPMSGPPPANDKPKPPAMKLDAQPTSAPKIAAPPPTPSSFPNQNVDVSLWPTPLLEKNATALQMRMAKDAKSVSAADKELLLKIEGELSKRYAKETAPSIQSPTPSAPKVELCKRPVDIGYGLEYTGLKHHFLRTSKKEVGLGPEGGGVPGEKGANNGGPLKPTTLNDHSGQGDKIDAICTEQPDVDEDCVNNELEVGKPMGRWMPTLNDCHTVAADILQKCKKDDSALKHNIASDAGVP